MNPTFLIRLEEAIEANFGNSSYGAKDLAREMGMSQSSLLRKLRSTTGKSINQLISEYRLKKALELLKTEDISVSEVASKTGFSSPSYFASSFKKYFGYSPGDVLGHQNENSTVETHDYVSLHDNAPKQHKIARSRMILFAGLSVVIIIAALMTFLAVTGRFSKEISIAVLPFRPNSQDAGTAQLTEILWENVITTLAQIEVFDVRSAVSSGQYRDTTGKSIPKIGRELKVDYIIEGSVSPDGDQIKFWMQLIDAKKDHHYGKEEYTFPLSELHGTMLEIAEHTAYKLNTVLKPDERSAIQVMCSKSNESIQNYLKGNGLFTYEDLDKALPYYLKAIELDPTWPNPYYGLARVMEAKIQLEPKEEYYREWREALEKAHEINADGNSYYYLARYHQGVGNYKKSSSLFKKGIRKRPDDARIKNSLGGLCWTCGRWKEAEKWFTRVRQQYPDNVLPYMNLGFTYENLRDFPEAIMYYNRGLSVNPDEYFLHYRLADISLKWMGDPQEARKIIEESLQPKPWRGSDPILAYYMLTNVNIIQGRNQDALRELSRWFLEVPNQMAIYHYRPKYLYFAMVYGYLGDQNLECAYYDSTRIFVEHQMEELPNLRIRPVVISCLGMAYAGLGDTTRAHEMADRVKVLLRDTPDAWKGPYAMEDLAWIYTRTGNYNKALKIIRGLLSKPGPLTAKLLEIDPKWATLKDQPGFKKLIDKYSIPVVEVPEIGPVITAKKPTAPEITGPSFTDERDGNVYHYNQIGSQVWMTENLAWLPTVSPPDSGSATEKHYYVYAYRGTSVAKAKETDNYAVYGVLYTWEAAMTACPEGWHLPSDEEWKILEEHLGMSETEVNLILKRESGSVGKKLKYTEGWKSKGNGDNIGGFYALPAGFRFYSNLFDEVGLSTPFWSTTELDASTAFFRWLGYEFDGVYRNFFDKRCGFSVRCVKD